MKKLVLLVASIFIFGLTSCSYKTCPTYADNHSVIKKANHSEEADI